MPALASPRLGVDLVEIKKAGAFYKRHKNRLASFFDEKEIRYIRRAKNNENLAFLLAAKEAVFKTLSDPWMGPSGFKDIHIILGKKKISCRVGGKFRSKASFCFEAIRDKKYVIVTCKSGLRCAGIS